MLADILLFAVPTYAVSVLLQSGLLCPCSLLSCSVQMLAVVLLDLK